MAKERESRDQNDPTVKADDQAKKCGIIMPIADNVGYPLGHWRDVLAIIEEAFEGTEFEPNLVSKKDSIGLIHESIVTNIYSNEIVVCDVSTKNPNVMFELGMRLAFDKPVIIIKDEKTDYSFDTGLIEHLNYPSSLRFQDIVLFKRDLLNRAKATYEAAKDPNYSPYLKSFNKAIVPARIENIEVTDLQYLVDSVKNISSDVERLTNVIITGNIDSSVSQKTGSKLDRGRIADGDFRNLRNAVLEIAATMDWEKLSHQEASDMIYRNMPVEFFTLYSPKTLSESVASIIRILGKKPVQTQE